MYKLIIISLFISSSIFAKKNITLSEADSLSYNYFVTENWSQLIELSKVAEQNNIDFKYLQQRVGYAFFVTSNYYKAIQHYKKSLKFDVNDEISHLYLYYSALNIGDESMARYHLAKLPEKTQESLQAKAFRPISAVDIEYNYKINNYELRSNPNYSRLGLNSQLGYRLNLYQSISRFNQISNYTNIIQQDEYFGSLSYSLFDRTNLNFGYHYVGTTVDIDPDSYFYPGHILFGKLSQKINKLDLAFNASVLNSTTYNAITYSNEQANSTQLGMEIGYVIPSEANLYLKCSVINVNDSVGNRIVFAQTIGMFAVKNIWLEGALTLGNLNNFVDADGLYFYNSIDPTVFRTGLSAFWYLNKHLIFYSNYTFDKKLIIETQNNYNQHSITGGIIWKI